VIKKLLPIICLFISTLFLPLLSTAQTILQAGDIAFTGYITADDNNVTQDDVISFVLLKDIDVNTSIYFTDLGWTDANTFQPVNPCGVNTGSYNDGIIQWTSTTVLYCGTQITINCRRALTANSGTVTAIQSTFNNSNAYLHLNGNGDQLLAYQGTALNPEFIAGISINRAWDLILDSCEFTSGKSTLPSALSTFGIALFPGAVNAQYNCSITSGDTLSLLSATTDVMNWNLDTTSFPPVPSNFQLPILCAFSGCALPPAQITTPPVSQTLCELSDFTLSVVAIDAISYQWQQNIGGTWFNVIDTLPFSGSTTDTLHFTSAPFALHLVAFRCLVNGAAPPIAISSSATITINRVPGITAQTPTRAICEGVNVSFSVSTYGAGLTYQWQFDNGGGWTNLTNTPPYSNTTNAAFTITATPYSLHLTNYRCIVTGTCAPPAISMPVYVFVNQLPTITLEPESDTICVGSSTSFIVNAFGASLTYRWQVDNGSGYTNLTNTPPHFGFNNDTLLITSPSISLSGNKYRCVITGVCAPSDTSQEVILNIGDVPSAPLFSLGDTTLCQNTNELFAVTPVDGISTYTWNYSGTDAMIISNGDTTATLSLGATASGGTIDVQAVNFCGVSSIVIQNINVNVSYLFLDSISVCPGDSAFIFSTWQSLEGDYSEPFSTTEGCDSTYTTRLKFHPIYNEHPVYTLCFGDSLFAAGIWQTQVGIYTDSLSSIFGCDSIVNSTLDFYPIAYDSVSYSMCIGDSVFLGGVWQTIAGDYNDVLSSINNCDSTVYTHLIVHALPLVTLTLDTTVCINWISIDLFGESPQGGIWSGAGVNANAFEPNMLGPGAYPITYTYVDSNLCMNSATDTITVDLCTGIEEISSTSISIYPNPAKDVIRFQLNKTINGQAEYRLTDVHGRVLEKGNLDQNNMSISVSHLSNGIYFIQCVVDGDVSSGKFIVGR